MSRVLSKIIEKLFYRYRNYLFKAVSQAQKEIEKSKADNILERVQEKGKNINLKGDIFVSHPVMLCMGNNVHIGQNAFFYTDGGLTIGDNAHISRNVTIYSSSHNYEGKALPYDNERLYKPVIIEKNVWIGMNVSISPGVTIGEGAIIGLGAVITKDVPPFSIVGNQPYRIIKTRNRKNYENLKKSKIVGGENGNIIPCEDQIHTGRSIFDLDQDKVFFIVSTGRSGSKAIAKILSQHPEITCRHEPKGELIRISTDYEHHKISKEEAKKAITKLYNQTSNIFTDFYGESDQKISNLIDIYAELFPKAKFLWLIRNAKDVIKSTYGRGWFDDREFGYSYRSDVSVETIYSDLIYSINRVNASKIIGQLTKEEWVKMTPFERNCWYWQYWNKKILEQLNRLDKSSWTQIKLESFDFEINSLISFLQITYFEFELERHNKANYNLKEDLTADEKKFIKFWCGDLMKKYYRVVETR